MEERSTEVKSFKYGSQNQKAIHNFLEKVLTETIKPSFFVNDESKPQNQELIRKFRDYENFKYLANRWLWETFFKYEEPQIKWMFQLAKTLKSEFGADSNEALIQLFIRSMSLAPPEKVKVERQREPVVKKEEKPLTLDDVDNYKEQSQQNEEINE